MSKDSNPNTLTVIDRSCGPVESGESLNVYMKALQKMPLLSRTEEIQLAEAIRDSKRSIIEVCCEIPDFYAELFLIKDLSLTEQKKLFLAHLDEESGRAEVVKLLKRLEELLIESMGGNKDSHTGLLTYLQTFNFTLMDLRRMSKSVRETASKPQTKRLNENLQTFKFAKDRMITSNLRLVFSRAKIYMNKGLSLEDLLQEGNLGLIKAIEKYDVSKGYKFGTYATWWIDQALGRAVADKGRLIRIPVHMVENINKVSKANKALTQKLGRAPTLAELSETSALSEDKIRKVQDIAVFPQSVEEPQGEVGIALAEYLVDEDTPSPQDIVEQKEIAERVRFLLSRLDPREEKIIRMRFGIGERKPVFLDAIGKSCNITGERVRQLLNRSLIKLNTYNANAEKVENDWAEFKRGHKN